MELQKVFWQLQKQHLKRLHNQCYLQLIYDLESLKFAAKLTAFALLGLLKYLGPAHNFISYFPLFPFNFFAYLMRLIICLCRSGSFSDVLVFWFVFFLMENVSRFGINIKKSTVFNKYKAMKKKSTTLNLFEYHTTVASLGLSCYLIAEAI